MKKLISILLSLVMFISVFPPLTLNALAANDSTYKIVLTWKSTPRDLDSHLIGKDSGGNDFHLYFSNQRINDTDGKTLATLDVDDTSGYGPENTTIFKSLKDVTYYFYIYNYSKDRVVSGCGAQVKIYKENGSVSKLMGTYTAPTGSGDYWNLFQLRNGKLTVVNRIGTEPMANVGGFNTSLICSGENNYSVYDTDAFISNNILHLDNLNNDINLKLDNVTAKYNSSSHDFNKEISIDNNRITGGLTFSKSEFRDYIIPAQVASSLNYTDLGTHNIYLTKDRKDGKPYVSTVFAKQIDKENSAKYKEVQSESLNIKKGKKYDIYVTGGNIDGKVNYILSQDSNHKISNDTGVFSSTELYSHFKENATIYAYIKKGNDDNSVTSEPVKLKLKKPNKDIAWLDDLSENGNISLLKDNSITIGDKVPIVGGAKIDLDLVNFPVGVELDNDTFKISLGFNIFTKETEYYSKNDGSKGSSKTKWEFFKDFVKKADECDTVDQLQKLKNTQLANQFGTSKKTALTADLLGYLEGQIVDGKLLVTEAKGRVAFEFLFKYTQHFSVSGVPAYFYVNAGAEAAVQLTRARPLLDDKVPLDFGISLEITPSVKIGGGVGVRDAISLGLWGKGSLPFKNDFYKKYRELALKGEFGAEAEFLCFSGTVTLLDGEVSIYKGYYDSSDNKAKARRFENKKADNNYTVDYSVMPRDYASSSSSWLSGRPAVRRSRGISSEDVNISALKTSIFKNSKTQLVSFGNKLMMVWIDDDSSRDDYNRMKLVYSVYSNGAWSEPKAVYDDGNNDNCPSIISDGENVYVAWQKVNKSIVNDDLSSFNSMLSNVDIYFAKYDSDKDEFVDAYSVSNDKVYDYLPSLAFNNGKVELYYVTNSSNDLSATGSNTIKSCGFKGAVKSYKTGLNEVLALDCASCSDGDVKVAYLTDKDGSSDTLYDTQISINGEEVTNNTKEDSAITALKYGSLNNKDTLFYADDTNIYYLTDNGVKKVFNSVRSVDGNMNIVNYNNKTQLFWTEFTDSGSDIFTCSYEDGAWTEPVQITDTNCLLSDVCFGVSGGKVISVFDRTQRTKRHDENSGTDYYESGQTDLCQLSTSGTSDISVSIPFIEESFLKEGENTNIETYVENHGTSSVENIEFTVKDTNGYEKTFSKAVNLKSGESKSVVIDYPVPENLQSTTLTVEANADNDNNPENNSAEYEIGNVNLAVNDLVVEYVGDCYNISGIVTNKGVVDAENVTIDVGVRDKDYIVSVSSPFDLAKGESRAVTLTLSADELGFGDDESEVIVYLTASADSDNVSNENNCSAIAVEAPHVHTFSKDWVVTKEPTCTEKGTKENVCDVCEETVERSVDAKGHTYDDGVVETAATCTSTGTMIYTCVDCGATKTGTINKLPHQYDSAVTQPTCVDQGYTTYTCKNCGYTYVGDYVNALGHDYVDGTCSRCGKKILSIGINERKKITIDKASDKTLLAFTPEESGTYYFYSDSKSDTYGYIYDSDFNQLKSNNDSGDEDNFKISYDFEAGKTYYLGAKYNSSSRTGTFDVCLFDSYTGCHSYKLSDSKDAECTHSGYNKYTCEVCGRTYTENINALGHDFVDDVCTRCGKQLLKINLNQYLNINVKDAGDSAYIAFTPEQSGTYYFFSDVNDDTYGYVYDSSMKQIASNNNGGDNYNFKISYNFEAGQTYYLVAKYNSSGKTGSFAVGLFDSYTDGHKYVLSDHKDADCENSGYNKYTCEVCGRTYTENINALGHNFVDDVCTRCGTELGQLLLEEYSIAKGVEGTKSKYFRFVPEQSGTYYFYSHTKDDTYAYLCDENMKQLAYNDDGEGCSNNFQISYALEGGKTYYLKVRYYSESTTGDIPVCVSLSPFAHRYIQHHYEATDVLCGYDVYTCEYCDSSYTTEYIYPTLVENEVKNITVPKERDNYKGFEFTPKYDGSYLITACGQSDIPWINIYDEDGGYIEQHCQGENSDTCTCLAENLEANKTYRVYVNLYNDNEKIEITANHVNDSEVIESAALTREKSFTIIENTGGEYETDSNGEKYYIYYPSFNEALSKTSLRVTYKDGSERVFKYNEDDNKYYDDSGKTLSVSYYTTDQNQNHWTVGNTYSVDFCIENYGKNIVVKNDVTIVENPVDRIEYIPKEQLKFRQYSEGYWANKEDGGKESKYYYYYCGFQDGDKIKIFNKDNTESEITYHDEGFWTDSNGNQINYNDSPVDNIWDTQLENPWDYGKNNGFTVSYMGKSVFVPVEFIGVTNVAYVQGSPIKLNENYDGETVEDANGNSFFKYNVNASYLNSNDLLTVTYSDGSVFQYKSYRGDSQLNFEMYDEESDRSYSISSADFTWSDTQDSAHWSAGNSYTAKMQYLNYTFDVQVEIIPDEIESIEYSPDEPVSYYEYQAENSDEEDEENSSRYFNIENRIPHDNDKLKVLNKDGTAVEYTYDSGYEEFKDENGSVLPQNWSVSSDQDEKPWTVGSENYAIFSILNHSVNIPVTILENPIKSLKYIPVSDYVVYADSGYDYIDYGEDSEDLGYTRYSYCVRAGDKIKVAGNDGKEVEYTAQFSTSYYDEDCFVDANGNKLEYDWSLNDTQKDNPWTVGSENNYFTFTIENASQNINVSVAEAEIEGISYNPANPIAFTYGYDGELNYSDYLDRDFTYYEFSPVEGDTFTVKYKNGTNAVYSYNERNNAWISESGGYIKNLSSSQYENQSKQPWTVGGENYAVFKYKDFESRVPVIIKDTDVSKIEFIPASKLQLIEEVGGRYDNNSESLFIYDVDKELYKQGNILRVTYKDGSVKDFTCNSDSNFVYGEDSADISYSDNQKNVPWKVGGENEAVITYAGVSTTVNFTIEQSPYKSIAYKPSSALALTLGKDYRYDTDEVDTLKLLKAGDILTLTKKDGSVSDYTLEVKTTEYDDESDSEYNFINDKGDIIPLQYIDFDADTSSIAQGKCTLSIHYAGVGCEVPVSIINPCAEGHKFSGITCTVCGFSDFSKADAKELVPGVTSSAVIPENGFQYFSFTPEESGVYQFASLSNDDTYGYLYSSNGTLLENNDDGDESDYNFCIPYSFEAGKTYYFACRFYDKSKSGSYNVLLSKVDFSALDAALNKVAEYDSKDYSKESYQHLQNVYSGYSDYLNRSISQSTVDYAVSDILTAISNLVPYLYLTVKSENGTVNVSGYDKADKYSLLFGDTVTLTATPDEGYVFDGWYETVTKRIRSKDEKLTFKITSNTDFEAIFIKEQSATLTFENENGWIAKRISKTVSEWSKVSAIEDLLPDVPYKLGFTNGRWVYDSSEVLQSLKSGKDVSITPEYDKTDYENPAIPTPQGDEPALNLYYQLDAENNVGSFTMAAGIPDGCRVESIGIAFYYKKASTFNPNNFDLNINNKMLTSKFEASSDDGIYTVDVKKFSSYYNWASKGYVTYYDEDGSLKTAYSNQINIVNRQEAV